MKSRFLSSFIGLFLCLGSLVQAQDVYVPAPNPNPDWESVEFPSIIFTEYRGDRQQTNYVEITNTEDTAVDLSAFRLVAGHFREYDTFNPDERWYEKNWLGAIAFDSLTMLEAGESMVFAYIFDKAISTTDLDPKTPYSLSSKTDWPIFKDDASDPNVPFMNQPELLRFDFDSVGPDGIENYMMVPAAGRTCYGLWYKYEHADSIGMMVEDSLMVDVVNLWMEDDGSFDAGFASNVAGIVEATWTHTLVRKFGSSSSADWDISRGISTGDSYWMPVPNSTGKSMYTTLGNHGDFNISLEAKTNAGAVVNSTDKTITVPWEAVRGDSVRINYLEIGDGMAWEYVRDSVDVGDSAYTRVRDGDLFNAYAFGSELRSETYTFIVSDATPDLAISRSKVSQYADGAYNVFGAGYLTITSGEAVMDSIINIRNQMRIDSLIKYAEIPPMASAEIIFIDNDQDRIDLIDGDIFRVTSEDKSVVKDYYLQVNDYDQNDNTELTSIRWPDYDVDDFFDWEFLRKDTLPDFTPGKFNYKLVLPMDYVNVPALFATTADLNTQLVVNRALNLTGSAEERTTTFTVISESDTLESVYKVVFELDLGGAMQLTSVDPFISEHIGLRHNGDQHIELFNPNNGTESLDMSRYMMVLSGATTDPNTAMTYTSADAINSNNQKFYIPGYKFNYNKGGVEDDFTAWIWKDGIVGGITPDADVDAFVSPGDVLVISSWNTGSANESKIGSVPMTEISDLNLNGNVNYPNAGKGITNFTWNSGYFLYEILNDSILNGTKGIWDSSDDYRLVDRLTLPTSKVINGVNFFPQTMQYRKPYVQMGNLGTDDEGAFHPSPDTCEFFLYSRRAAPEEWKTDGLGMGAWLGYHDMDPITFHMSTVTSNAYKVDLGYEGDLSIKGEMQTITVADFIANLDQPDSAQSITVERADVAQSPDAIVATGDVCVVLSADSVNTTKYTIEASALSSDVALTSVGDLGIIVDNLTLKGFGYDKAIADVLAGVEANELSVINIIDEGDNLVPLLTRSLDTSLVEPIMATMVVNGIYFEVIAEDGTKVKYALMPEATASEAYLTSNMFTVNQEDVKSISGVAGGFAVPTFLSFLNASGNATLDIKNKSGASRTDGMLQIDDYVTVTSEDASVVVRYYINFNGEEDPDVPNKLKQSKSNSLINVYPNPTTSQLNIDNVKIGSVVQIIALNGSMVYTNVVNDNNCTIDMSQMNTGLYIVRMVERDATTVFRVLKK